MKQDVGGWFKGSVEFLNYGPLGLAALMLVLLAIALVLRNVDGPRERLMKLMLYVGSFCFVFALFPQYYALIFTDTYSGRDARQVQTLRSVVSAADRSLPQLERLRGLVVGGLCSGGSSGIPAQSAGTMGALAAGVINELTTARTLAQAALNENPANSGKSL